jgi:hypothetical protein
MGFNLNTEKDGIKVTITLAPTIFPVPNASNHESIEYEWFVYAADGATRLEPQINTDTEEEKAAKVFRISEGKVIIDDVTKIDSFLTVYANAHFVIKDANGNIKDKIFIATSEVEAIYEEAPDLVSSVTINLDNDVAFIPRDLEEDEDDDDLLQGLTMTTVTVLRGDTDITNTCSLVWSVSNDAVELQEVNNSQNKPTKVYVRKVPKTVETFTVTVSATYNN